MAGAADDHLWQALLGRASARVLVAAGTYASLDVACRLRARPGLGRTALEQLRQELLDALSAYTLSVARALAENGTPPLGLDVSAEAVAGDEPDAPLSELSLQVHGEAHGSNEATLAALAQDRHRLEAALPNLAPTTALSFEVHLGRARRRPVLPRTQEHAPPESRAVSRRPTRFWLARSLRLALLVLVLLAAVVLGLRVAGPGRLLVLEGQGPPAGATESPSSSSPAATGTGPTDLPPRATATSSPPVAVAALAATPAPPPPPGTTAPVVAATVQARPPTNGPASGQPLAGFLETFTSNERNWPDDPSSTASFAEGGYRIQPRDPGRFVAIRAPGGSFRDVRLTGTFRKLDGPPGGGYGLIVRDEGQQPLDGRNQTGRFCVAEVNDLGQVGLWRREADQWVALLPWTPSDAVHAAEATNAVLVEASGSHLTMDVNGARVADLDDPTLADGSVGLFVGGDGNDVLVEQFAVEPLR